MSAILRPRESRPHGGRWIPKNSGRVGSALRLGNDSKRLAYHEKKPSPCSQTEGTSHRHSRCGEMDQNPCPSVEKAAGVQDASVVNGIEAEKCEELAMFPDSQMRLFWEQAARQASFVDLLIDLVPSDALIPQEGTGATSCSEKTVPGDTSRGLLRWQHQCVRYDPDVLRATSFCLEQYVRDQEKRKSSHAEWNRGKRPATELSATGEESSKQRQGKHLQKQLARKEKGRAQGHGEYHARLQQVNSGCGTTKDKRARLESRKEEGSHTKLHLRRIQKNVGGNDDIREDSREGSDARENMDAPCGDISCTRCPPPMGLDEHVMGRGGNRRTRAEAGTSKSLKGSRNSVKKSKHQWSGFKRRKRSQSHPLRPGWNAEKVRARSS